MSMHWTEKQAAVARIGEELGCRGWTLFGYSPDRSDGRTDYYCPASWDGIATHPEHPGVVVCVAVDSDCLQRLPDDWPAVENPTPKGRAWHVEIGGRIMSSGTGLSDAIRGGDKGKGAARICDQIEAAAFAKPASVESTAQIGDTNVSRERDWTWLTFPAKPDEAVRGALKSAGARWSKKRAAWFFIRTVSDEEIAALLNKTGGSQIENNCDDDLPPTHTLTPEEAAARCWRDPGLPQYIVSMSDVDRLPYTMNDISRIEVYCMGRDVVLTTGEMVAIAGFVTTSGHPYIEVLADGKESLFAPAHICEPPEGRRLVARQFIKGVLLDENQVTALERHIAMLPEVARPWLDLGRRDAVLPEGKRTTLVETPAAEVAQTFPPGCSLPAGCSVPALTVGAVLESKSWNGGGTEHRFGISLPSPELEDIWTANLSVGSAYDYIPEWARPHIPKLYACEKAAETRETPLAYIKLFTPDSSWTWYIMEYDPAEELCFGLIIGHETERGYFSLKELRQVRGKLGLPIERELWTRPTPVNELPEYQEEWGDGGPYPRKTPAGLTQAQEPVESQPAEFDTPPTPESLAWHILRETEDTDFLMTLARQCARDAGETEPAAIPDYLRLLEAERDFREMSGQAALCQAIGDLIERLADLGFTSEGFQEKASPAASQVSETREPAAAGTTEPRADQSVVGVAPTNGGEGATELRTSTLPQLSADVVGPEPLKPAVAAAAAPLPDRWTVDDVRFLLNKLDEGVRALVSDTQLGLPTIHSIGGEVEHCGYGLMCLKTPEVELTFDAGGAMQRTPSGQGWSQLRVNRGEYPYDFEAAKAKLAAYLPSPDVAAAPAAPRAAAERSAPLARAHTGSQLDPDVLDALSHSTCTDHRLILPAQLERKLYDRVNEVLTRLGGQWKSGKVKAHVFEEDPAPLVAEVLATGIMPPKNPLGFYPTPDDLVDEVIGQITVGSPEAILEPSAGEGAFVKALLARFPSTRIVAVELDPKRAAKLRQLGPRVQVVEGDFLQYNACGYDLVVMNPPFAVERDALEYIEHIRHALALLTPAGQLLAIVPAGLKFRRDRRTSELRALIEQNGQIEDIRAGAFDVSGTSVSTVLVEMQKPAAASQGAAIMPDQPAYPFTKQIFGKDAIDLLRQAAAIVPDMTGFGSEWTPEDGAVFNQWELELVTGRTDKKASAFYKALTEIHTPGALHIALTRINTVFFTAGDRRRREAIEARLAAIEKALA